MKAPIKFLFLLPLLASCGGSGESTSSSRSTTAPIIDYSVGTYSNMLNVSKPGGSFYNNEIADPSVVRGDDGYFYCFSTSKRVLRSEDGCEWELYSENIIPQPEWGGKYYSLWAPDVVEIDGTWIYYYSLSNIGEPLGIGYAIADACGGPYEDCGKLFTGEEMGIENCIDPQVFVDDDGKVYLTCGSFEGLWMVELTEDGMDLKNGLDYQKQHKTLIAGADSHAWEGNQFEGSYIIKKGQYYYYFGSSGGFQADGSYTVYCGRSKNIKGPYVDDKNRPLTDSHGDNHTGALVLNAALGKNKGKVKSAGHNSVVIDDKGDFWIYYHAYCVKDNFYTRHLFMDKLTFDGGFPHVNGYCPSYEEELDGPAIAIYR